jgi:CDP-diacylglycerol--glycerol-3-phosphate 3-phosphatidyltransferase
MSKETESNITETESETTGISKAESTPVIDTAENKVSKYSRDKLQIFTIPNILTYMRILCVPAFIAVYIAGYIVGGSNASLMWAFGIFVFASFTDVIDGKIARKFNLVSDIGKALDPLADKLLQVSVLVLLSVSENIHWIFAALILAKELYMIVGGILLVRKNIIAQAVVWGKVAAFLLAVGIILGFFVNVNQIFRLLTSIVLAAGVAFTYYAAYVYTLMSIKAYKKHLAQGNDERVYIVEKK